VEGVEASGKTVDEAIEKALAELGLDESEVEIDVLSAGRAGILGIGGDRARVKVRPKSRAASAAQDAASDAPGSAATTGEDTETAVSALEHLLEMMMVDAAVRVRAPETPGDGLGLVIAHLRSAGQADGR